MGVTRSSTLANPLVSSRQKLFAKLLPSPSKATDYYFFKAKMDISSAAPFYSEFVLSKVGTVVAVLPNRLRSHFDFSSGLRIDVLEYMKAHSKKSP